MVKVSQKSQLNFGRRAQSISTIFRKIKSWLLLLLLSSENYCHGCKINHLMWVILFQHCWCENCFHNFRNSFCIQSNKSFSWRKLLGQRVSLKIQLKLCKLVHFSGILAFSYCMDSTTLLHHTNKCILCCFFFVQFDTMC